MDEQTKRRRKVIATLTVVLPIAAGLVLAAIAHFAGQEEQSIEKPEAQPQRGLVEAATPAATGSPAPRVRLAEAPSGRRFDSASLGRTPYGVVFITSRCDGVGNFLGRAVRGLAADTGAVLVITADPRVDSPRAVRAWLGRHHIAAGGPLHYLVGSEREVRGYWNAWGFKGPKPECGSSVAVHLVGSSKGSYINTGILDIEPGSPAELLTVPLLALDH